MRYILRAYVVSDGDVSELLHTTYQGSMTFEQIYMRSPDDYRFAILEHEDKFHAVDLWRSPLSEDLTIQQGPTREIGRAHV